MEELLVTPSERKCSILLVCGSMVKTDLLKVPGKTVWVFTRGTEERTFWPSWPCRPGAADGFRHRKAFV